MWQSLGDSHKFSLNEDKKKILEILEYGSFKPSELAEETGINNNRIRQHLFKMKKESLINYDDKTKTYNKISPV